MQTVVATVCWIDQSNYLQCGLQDLIIPGGICTDMNTITPTRPFTVSWLAEKAYKQTRDQIHTVYAQWRKRTRLFRKYRGIKSRFVIIFFLVVLKLPITFFTELLTDICCESTASYNLMSVRTRQSLSWTSFQCECWEPVIKVQHKEQQCLLFVLREVMYCLSYLVFF